MSLFWVRPNDMIIIQTFLDINYRIDLKDMVSKGKIYKAPGNGKIVESKRSVLPLNGKELCKWLYNHKIYILDFNHVYAIKIAILLD